MEKSERRMKMLLLYSFLFICITPVLFCTAVNGDFVEESIIEKPSLSQRFRAIALELGKSSQGPWGKFKSVVYQVQEKFFPPSLDFRSRDGLSNVEGDVMNSAAARVADAAEKSFGASESALEGSAGSMSKIVGEAVHKTKEKVKETMSDKDEDEKDEL